MDTKIGKSLCVLLITAAIFFPFAVHAEQLLRLAGAPTASLPLKDAVDILKTQGLKLEISTEGGTSSSGIGALGIGDADVAMCSHFVTAEDRAQFPGDTFTEVYFGEEAAAIVVSDDVWQGGIRALTKAQMKGIYEGKIKNWKEVGGADLQITGYTPEPGNGVWSCYIQWLYDDPGRIRPNRFGIASTDDDAKMLLDSTPGSIVCFTMTYAIQKNLHYIAIKADDGTIIDCSPASVANHSYPMSRPLLLVVKGRPLGKIRALMDFMLSDQGQVFVHKHNYLTLKDLGIARQSFD